MTSLRSVLLASAFVFATSVAIAANNNNQNNSSNTTNNITNQGGQGGAGGVGFGGNATANAGAVAGAVAGASSNASNRNNIRNTNIAQGGSARQGQAQGQVQGIANSGNATINNNVPANTTNEIRYSGSYTVHNTPDVYAPPIAGGANPCVVGVSAGGAVAGFGISFGLTRNDDGCERRNTAALLHNMGEREVAQEVLCETESVRQARLRAGRPCYIDRVAQAAAARPVVVTQASLDPVIVTQSQQAVAVTPAARPARPATGHGGSGGVFPEYNIGNN